MPRGREEHRAYLVNERDVGEAAALRLPDEVGVAAFLRAEEINIKHLRTPTRYVWRPPASACAFLFLLKRCQREELAEQRCSW